MIQYLVILLDDSSVSFCNYSNKEGRRLISLDDLGAGVKFAMKNNLMVEFVIPSTKLPVAYWTVMSEIDYHLIAPGNIHFMDLLPKVSFFQYPTVVIFDKVFDYLKYDFETNQSAVINLTKKQLFRDYRVILDRICEIKHLSINITDVESFSDKDFEEYEALLRILSDALMRMYSEGKLPNLNILTDRIMLEKMNNCNAGDSNITLAPDGKFYICPAFYYAGECDGTEVSQGDVCQKGYAIGSLKDGLDIKNPQLYKLDHAPLCRNCDAYQCKRCIWLNRKTTLEVNTPSHEQCVMAHLERNASSQLLADIRKLGTFLPGKEIKEIDYLDPFDVRKEW